MADQYRLIACDKLHHVIKQLQRNLTDQLQSVKPLPIPGYLALQDVTLKQVASLGLVDKLGDKYETGKLVFGLRLRLSDDGTIFLMGAATRHWNKPTISADQVQILGSEWKHFEVGLTQSTDVKKLPPRFSALSETIILTVTYLQKMVGDSWCDFIMTLGMLPAQFQEEFDLDLPCWCSGDSFQTLITSIKKQRKTVNVESKADPRFPREVPDILVSVNNELVELSTLVKRVAITKSGDTNAGRTARASKCEEPSRNQDRDAHWHSNREVGASSVLSGAREQKLGGGGNVYGDSATFRGPPPPVSSSLLALSAEEPGGGRAYGGRPGGTSAGPKGQDGAYRRLPPIPPFGKGTLLDGDVPSLPQEILLLPRHTSPPPAPSAPTFPGNWDNLARPNRNKSWIGVLRP